MSSLRHIPLGHPIPDCPHAISVSLPTLADVIGYELKQTEVIRHVPTGYPRFVLHPFVKRYTAEFARRHGLDGLSVWIATSPRLGEQLLAWVGAPGARLVTEGRLTAVAFRPQPDHDARAKVFLQHTGGFLSSRQAEDALAAAGLLPAPASLPDVGDPVAAVKAALARAYPGAGPEDLFLATNGMNAIHSVFRTAAKLQATRGRTVWIQLGWIYLDTIAILEKFTGTPAQDHIVLPDVHDLAALRAALEAHRGRVAGIVTEVPTNPLVQTADIAAVGALARAHGAHLVLDTSIVSPWSVDVLAACDVTLSSLTKYAASDGDLLAGSAAVNPAGPDAAAFRAGLAARIEPPYARDIARLAHELRDLDAVRAGIHAATPRVVEFLSAQPEVTRVHWALAPASRANYLRVARDPGATGCMITFELRPGALAAFYDAVRLPKGPSFGLKNTLICPFMYLGHYDLVSNEQGLARLARHGLNPELLRLSVGTEPVEEILDALAEGFAALRRS